MSLRRAILSALASVALVLVLPLAAQAQTGTVRGTVTARSGGEPLANVRVSIVGTNRYVVTNANGEYELSDVRAGDAQLRVAIIGYQSQTATLAVTTGQTATMDFVLPESVFTLDAVTVNAISGREQRERELGTNTSNIALEKVEPAKVTSVADILSGRAEGVILQDVNGTSGTAQRIRIRGANSLSLNNEPQVYIDGILTDASSSISQGVGGQESSRLNDINPNDIENIEIVKGPAAAALYGTAAANGVLLITTKRGRAGAPEWSFYAEAGRIDDITDYPANFLSVQFEGAGNEDFFDPTNGQFNTAAYTRCPNTAAAAAACAQDRTVSFNTSTDPRTRFFETGDRQRYGLSVRGGSEAVTYFVSGELEQEQGVVNFNQRDKVTVRANLDARVTEQFDLSVSTGFSQVKNDFNNNDNSIFSPILNGILGEAYFVPESAKPTDPAFFNSRPGVNRENYGFRFNLTDLEHLVINDDVDRVTLSTTANFRPLSWLSFNGTGGMDLVDGHTFQTLQPDLLPIAQSFALGFRQSDRANNYVFTANGSGIASFSLTQNLVSTTTVGASFNQERSENTTCFGAGIVQGTSSCGTTSTLLAVDEDFSTIKTVGAYVSQEFAWRDRVFVSGAVRGDDNSAFGTDFGFVTYPSAQASWVIGEEDFFPQGGFVSALRLRAAYGQSGLRPGFRDAVTLFSPVTVARDGGDVPGITVNSTGNLDLKPERSREIELGADLSLFNDRVGIDFTYFDKRSKDALISRRLPPSFGVAASRFENLGEVKNAGTELAVNITAIDGPQFGLDFYGTVTTLSNEVIELGEGVEPIIFNRGLQRHQEGHPAGSFFQREVTWDDADGNGLLTQAEVMLGDTAIFIGAALPTWQSTVGANLRVFDWLTFGTLFEFRGGNYQGNDSEAFRCGFRDSRGCRAVGDPTASLEDQAAYIADRFLGSAFGFVEKADFGKWREFSVTLRTPRGVATRVRQLEGLSLTLAGRNLATWTSYPGLDPETVEGGGNVNFSQSEFNTQPPVRYLMIRLNYTIR